MRVLVACEFSQVVTQAFRNKGHEAFSCDILPTEGNPDWHIQGDVLEILNDFWDLMIAHPPCTYLTVRGRYRAEPEQKKAAENFFMDLVNIGVNKVCIENPKGVMSKLYRKPDQIVHPWQFGHSINKATCFWLYNLPKLNPTNIVQKEEPVHIDSTTGKKRYALDYLPGNAERWKIRSRTFLGIANAMAEQWG